MAKPPIRPSKPSRLTKPSRVAPTKTPSNKKPTPPLPKGRRTIPPGKFTIKQLLDSTRGNFSKQDWSRAKAQGRHFEGDKGLLYDTRIDLGKPSRAPWGIRFQTTTYAPEEFGKDAKGRFPRKWVQYIELPFDYDRANVRGHREFRCFCNCPRYRFVHHYVLWRAGHAPKPIGKGLQAPDYARRGTRAVGVCKHLVLALLAVNRASASNKLPAMLPDKAWAQIERYWAGVESGYSDAMMANLESAPDSVRKLAKKIATQDTPRRLVNNFSRKDWSAKGLKIPKPR